MHILKIILKKYDIDIVIFIRSKLSSNNFTKEVLSNLIN
jgi:hypothetical protein